MNPSTKPVAVRPDPCVESGYTGIHLKPRQGMRAAEAALRAWLDELGLASLVRSDPSFEQAATLQLRLIDPAGLAPEHDTLELARLLDLQPHAHEGDLFREIVLCLLAAPQPFVFPSLEELQAHVRTRAYIVQAARKTALAFDTDSAERPVTHWVEKPSQGFVIRPGADLIEALIAATQPVNSQQRYAFSCYRATEYVVLLGIAQELKNTHPELLRQLQSTCEIDFIRSRRFHDVFLQEHGSHDEPLPARYYVPGDRVWFKNPDERSSDIPGFEGSWVIYLGSGLFCNFWEPERPYTLRSKCLEVFHWRHGVEQDDEGRLVMNEAKVASHVAASLSEPARADAIVKRMMRMRDPSGVYADGGCIDSTREHPRWVCPSTCTIKLPAIAGQ
ncbi:MAG TPA: hypothetical protein VFM48_00325 [Aquabacterium sp.]|nr:hypothetical protein [Aquabacterium sp.]